MFNKKRTLKEVLLEEHHIPESFYIQEEDLAQWKIKKGAKQIPRIHKKTGEKPISIVKAK